MIALYRYSNSQVKDERLRIDLASLKQEIGREEILVKWAPGGRCWLLHYQRKLYQRVAAKSIEYGKIRTSVLSKTEGRRNAVADTLLKEIVSRTEYCKTC